MLQVIKSIFLSFLDIADTTATDFDITSLGGTTANVGKTKFSITMWLKPNAATPNGPIYSIFRVTTNVADINPTTSVF